jgi:hypothetical protein
MPHTAMMCAELFARVVELVDTGDSKSPAVTGLAVRVRPRVPLLKEVTTKSSFSCQLAENFYQRISIVILIKV